MTPPPISTPIVELAGTNGSARVLLHGVAAEPLEYEAPAHLEPGPIECAALAVRFDERIPEPKRVAAADAVRTRLQQEAVKNALQKPEPAATDGGSDDEKAPRKSIATRLLELVRPQLDLFHDAAGDGYADLVVDGHRETHAIGSRAFRDWLCGMFFAVEERAVPANALTDARGTLAAEARFRGPQRKVGVRVVRDSETCWLDLGDPTWRCVRITPESWSIEQQPDVIRFRRPATMRPLPVPAARHGAGVEDLVRQLAGGAETVRRTLGWLVAALLGIEPYPILVVAGEQGSAKSSTAETLRKLIDPAEPLLRGAPREERDLAIAANNAAIVALDNLSHIPEWLADGLCRLGTGAGFATRTLYADAEETTFGGARPLLLNGIPDLLVRPDLADRAILLELPAIHDTARREVHDLRVEFEREHPRLLGLLLDLAVATLRARGELRLSSRPRMADFARTLAALDVALGRPGWTLDPYLEGVRNVAASAAGCDPLTDLVIGLGDWTGNATELLLRLEANAKTGGQESILRSRAWPGGPSALTDRLRRLAPALRSLGVEVSWRREGKGRKRVVRLVRLPIEPDSGAAQPADEAADDPSDSLVRPVVRQSPTCDPHGIGLGGRADAADAADDGSRPLSSNDSAPRLLREPGEDDDVPHPLEHLHAGAPESSR